MDRKLKVVWISFVSNKKIRDHLIFENTFFERVVRWLFRRPKAQLMDSIQWVTNGLNVYEHIPDIELHLIAPHAGIKGTQEFELDNIHYHFFRSEDDYSFFLRRFKTPKIGSKFRRNRKTMLRFINQIRPDIIHIIGAENPQYSLVALDINPDVTPLIVSLDTLMSAPQFKENYFLSDLVYNYRSHCEKEILRHVQFLGSNITFFQKMIWENINPKVTFLNSTIFVGETINKSENKKIYDVIYYAKDIAKAVDVALNTMSLIVKKMPDIKMCIVGGCNSEFLSIFETMVNGLNLGNNIIYCGSLPTHEDVLQTVRQTKVALLPVKVDGITCTIREAMANGVPVVTTKTWGTPMLNEERKTAFIEDIEDYESLAKDVIELLENALLYNEMRENGFLFCAEKYSNEAFAKVQNEIYRALLNWKENGVAIPAHLCSVNSNGNQ